MSTPVVLCVDDEPIILQSLRIELKSTLKGICSIETAETGEEALDVVQEILKNGRSLAVLVSDQNMPGIKGHELLTAVKKICPNTFTVLLTGFSDLDGVQNAVNNAGLYRYLTKPWRKDEVVFTVEQALKEFEQEKLISEQRKKIDKLTWALTSALETANLSYDEDTGYHIQRVGEYSAFLAEKLDCNLDFINRIRVYSRLHDIGKVGISDIILNKPGKYTPEEYAVMKQHVLNGHRILDVEGIDPMAKNIAYYHHERWDGSGYLNGLAREQIPLEARITSVADVFDALVSVRVYKPAFSVEEATNHILDERGKQFDPQVVDCFSRNLDKILEIRKSITS